MQNFTFKYRHTETIHLLKGEHITSYGKFYFIFRDYVGVSFIVHNILKFFPLNKINNYISDANIRNSVKLYFTMNLKEDRYIYIEHNSEYFDLYSIQDKTIKILGKNEYNSYKITKGDYIFILSCYNINNYHFMVGINRYIVDLEENEEIRVKAGAELIAEPNVTAVVGLSELIIHCV